MRTYVKIILSVLVSFSWLMSMADENNNTLVVNLSKERIHRSVPSRGARKPSVHVICVINVENNEVTCEFDSEIESYEIWDEDGEIQYCSFGESNEFIEFLSSSHGCFQLRFITDEYVYIGFIEKQ